MEIDKSKSFFKVWLGPVVALVLVVFAVIQFSSRPGFSSNFIYPLVIGFVISNVLWFIFRTNYHVFLNGNVITKKTLLSRSEINIFDLSKMDIAMSNRVSWLVLKPNSTGKDFWFNLNYYDYSVVKKLIGDVMSLNPKVEQSEKVKRYLQGKWYASWMK
jgi:hypothetical protein